MMAGDKVSIYQKPLTGEDFEGMAVLISKEKPMPWACEDLDWCNYRREHTEHWNVRFVEDGKGAPTLLRSILCNGMCEPVFGGKDEG